MSQEYILRHLTSSAGASFANVTRHGGVEGISSDNVMDMSRRGLARLNNWINTLDSERGASKAKTGLNWRDERNCDRERLHLYNRTNSAAAKV